MNSPEETLEKVSRWLELAGENPNYLAKANAELLRAKEMFAKLSADDPLKEKAESLLAICRNLFDPHVCDTNV